MATTCSASSIRGLPPNLSLNFLLSSRAVPLATTKTTCSPTRRHIVLAICAGITPWAAAASDTVAELASVSMTVKSGARSARKLRTLSRLIGLTSQEECTPVPPLTSPLRWRHWQAIPFGDPPHSEQQLRPQSGYAAISALIPSATNWTARAARITPSSRVRIERPV